MKKIIWLIVGFIIGSLSITAVYSAIDFKADDKQVFTKQDLIETDISNAEFPVTALSNTLDKDKFIFAFDYPVLTTDGKDFKVEKATADISYNLNNYNICRNQGSSKTDCISQAKQDIKNRIDIYKQLAKDEAERLKAEVVKVDYSDEIKAEDLNLTTEEINN